MLWAGVTWADADVDRAVSACAPLKGKEGYYDCIKKLQLKICNGHSLDTERDLCNLAFGAYYASETIDMEIERQLIKAGSSAQSRRLQQKLTQ